MTDGFAGGVVGGEDGEDWGGVEVGLRFLSSPFEAWLVEVLDDVVLVGFSLASGWVWGCECECECPPSPVAMRNDLSMATNATKPAMMPTPSRRLRLGSRRTNLTLFG